MSNGRYGMFRESAVSSKRPVVRCKWAATKWSKCSKTCGRGRRTGTRIQTGGKSCTRKRTYRGSCRVKRCPRKCELVLFLFDNVINSYPSRRTNMNTNKFSCSMQMERNQMGQVLQELWWRKKKRSPTTDWR